MSANELTYQIGVTQIVVGNALAENFKFTAPRGMINGFVKIASGGGTLALVNALGSSTTAGYPISATDSILLGGPATFFLAASGATMVASVLMRYSAGYSTTL